MFLLLIKIRIASVLNMGREQFRRSALLSSGLAVLGVGLFAAMLLGFTFLFHIAAEMSLLSETLYQVFYFLFLFLLAGSTPFVASTLLHSSDYTSTLLRANSCPIGPGRQIAGCDGHQFAAVPGSRRTRARRGRYRPAIEPGGVAAAAALNGALRTRAGAPDGVGLLLLLGTFGAARLRTAITLLNAAMATVACITIVLEFAADSGEGGHGYVHRHVLGDGPLVARCPYRAVRLVRRSAFRGCRRASGRRSDRPVGGAQDRRARGSALDTLPAAWQPSDLGGKSRGGGEHGRGPEESRDRGGMGSSPLAALICKDWRYLKRDSILLSQLCMPLILYCVPFILTLQDPSAQNLPGRHSFFAAAIIGVILFMQTSILSLSSIGLESKAYWIVLMSPLTAETVLTAKFLLCTLFSAGIGVAFTLVASLLFGGGPLAAAIELAVVIVSAAALSGLGVGLAAMFPGLSMRTRRIG